MESSSTAADVPRRVSVSSSRRLNLSNHRLFFDRRYGWVFDEWKHPSQEALAGGRGMFCILPLAQGLFKRASDSINLAANFTLKVYENPDLISPQALQSILDKRLNELKSSIQKPDFSCFAPKGKSSTDSAIVPSRLQIESAGSQTG
ncbi:hypothetical protein K2173_007184 [Erythroxylum novogranatense]|uniref:Uncharacterized protein n=1 Tax=Erythroxylum novogranatense TaxID=1862640 RepID=A0AAV8SZJ7_9ROSI|nr:hypothetical protein K2173_007166 [Erythroxylum novogranatense]KAJ8759559.1 hypothetical protein K2173_007184 [Erythroxylum novogranatense]